jgi:hypothetical protein
MHTKLLLLLALPLSLLLGTRAMAEACNRDFSETLKWLRTTGTPFTLPPSLAGAFGVGYSPPFIATVIRRSADDTGHLIAVDAKKPANVIVAIHFNKSGGMHAWLLATDGTVREEVSDPSLNHDQKRDYPIADEFRYYADTRCRRSR